MCNLVQEDGGVVEEASVVTLFYAYKRQGRCIFSKKLYALPPPKATNLLKLEKAIKFFLYVELSLHEWIESDKYWDLLKSADLVWHLEMKNSFIVNIFISSYKYSMFLMDTSK